MDVNKSTGDGWVGVAGRQFQVDANNVAKSNRRVVCDSAAPRENCLSCRVRRNSPVIQCRRPLEGSWRLLTLLALGASTTGFSRVFVIQIKKALSKITSTKTSSKLR
ncbi:hypothetical protein E2C01_071326 [Portunus trituberculatus]|uniref:Uncharacterized protein n=1 Tax=Portunus trituberculatus TaxID=210409 RepID=A0A5B7HWP6_PORTR|nr:hypothetical protein [Portunus trituberculatus]